MYHYPVVTEGKGRTDRRPLRGQRAFRASRTRPQSSESSYSRSSSKSRSSIPSRPRFSRPFGPAIRLPSSKLFCENMIHFHLHCFLASFTGGPSVESPSLSRVRWTETGFPFLSRIAVILPLYRSHIHRLRNVLLGCLLTSRWKDGV